MGTLLANSVGSRGVRGLHSGGYYDDSHSPSCIVCAVMVCFTFALIIIFSLKEEAVWVKFIVVFILVLSIIVLCAACLKNEKKSLPVQPSRIEFGRENVVKKENKTLTGQPSRFGFIKANVVAFFEKLKPFLFLNKTKPPNSYCLESELTKSSLPVATYDNTILV